MGWRGSRTPQSRPASPTRRRGSPSCSFRRPRRCPPRRACRRSPRCWRRRICRPPGTARSRSPTRCSRLTAAWSSSATSTSARCPPLRLFPLEQLPEQWHSRMYDYPGIDVPERHARRAAGVRWSGGSIGYFPTYALGNLISPPDLEKVTDGTPDLDDSFEAGEFAPLRDWLREHLHRHGRKFTPAETLERVVGTTRDRSRAVRAVPPRQAGGDLRHRRNRRVATVAAMAKTRVGINGFGRIGRNFFRARWSAAPTSRSSRSTTSATRRRWRTC